jgi:hypothetical protein
MFRQANAHLNKFSGEVDPLDPILSQLYLIRINIPRFPGPISTVSSQFIIQVVAL